MALSAKKSFDKYLNPEQLSSGDFLSVDDLNNTNRELIEKRSNATNKAKKTIFETLDGDNNQPELEAIINQLTEPQKNYLAWRIKFEINLKQNLSQSENSPNRKDLQRIIQHKLKQELVTSDFNKNDIKKAEKAYSQLSFITQNNQKKGVAKKVHSTWFQTKKILSTLDRATDKAITAIPNTIFKIGDKIASIIPGYTEKKQKTILQWLILNEKLDASLGVRLTKTASKIGYKTLKYTGLSGMITSAIFMYKLHQLPDVDTSLPEVEAATPAIDNAPNNNDRILHFTDTNYEFNELSKEFDNDYDALWRSDRYNFLTTFIASFEGENETFLKSLYPQNGKDFFGSDRHIKVLGKRLSSHQLKALLELATLTKHTNPDYEQKNDDEIIKAVVKAVVNKNSKTPLSRQFNTLLKNKKLTKKILFNNSKLFTAIKEGFRLRKKQKKQDIDTTLAASVKKQDLTKLNVKALNLAPEDISEQEITLAAIAYMMGDQGPLIAGVQNIMNTLLDDTYELDGYIATDGITQIISILNLSNNDPIVIRLNEVLSLPGGRIGLKTLTELGILNRISDQYQKKFGTKPSILLNDTDYEKPMSMALNRGKRVQKIIKVLSENGFDKPENHTREFAAKYLTINGNNLDPEVLEAYPEIIKTILMMEKNKTVAACLLATILNESYVEPGLLEQIKSSETISKIIHFPIFFWNKDQDSIYKLLIRKGKDKVTFEELIKDTSPLLDRFIPKKGIFKRIRSKTIVPKTVGKGQTNIDEIIDRIKKFKLRKFSLITGTKEEVGTVVRQNVLVGVIKSYMALSEKCHSIKNLIKKYTINGVIESKVKT